MRTWKLVVLSVLSFACVPISASSLISDAPRANAQGKVFQYFMQIWLENENYEDVVNLPAYQGLAKQGILLTNYDAFTHPSQPNYIAAVGGATFGVKDDGVYDIPANVTNIFDLIEGKGLTWKAYNEQLPSPGWTGEVSPNGKYVRKHNPVISFKDISTNAERAANVVPADHLSADIDSKNVPEYSFYTPDINNDGHDTSSVVAGHWLHRFVTNVLNNADFMKDALVLLTFDESQPSAPRNHVWSCLIGGAIPPEFVGTIDDTCYTHYSALHTVEANWDLGSLGRGDADPYLANVFQFVANALQ
ncbi:hypothetical protein APHAL10511_003319 [Amanita phalloides]|nr:hypothetical protein APHAL10511_003319 [Amanita phalloides]